MCLELLLSSFDLECIIFLYKMLKYSLIRIKIRILTVNI